MDELAEQVAGAARRVAAAGLVSGTSGNISARDGDRVVVTETGAVLGELTARDTVTVSLEGDLLAGAGQPTSELPLHLAIYRHHGHSAVVHTHPRTATALSTVLDELPCIHYDMHAFGGAVRVAPYAAFGSEHLAEMASEALADRSAVLLSNHGAITCGQDLEAALRGAELLEWVCDVFWRARQIGDPRTLSEAQIAEVAEIVSASGYGRRAAKADEALSAAPPRSS